MHDESPAGREGGPSACVGGPCTCSSAPPLTRRAFLSLAGAVAADVASSGALGLGRAVAGPFDPADWLPFPIPADKKLAAEWVASLTVRGEPQRYSLSRGELHHIGMPVGGICAGHLYLGGDGRLWLWDIFNQPPAGEWRSTQGPHYANPAVATFPLEQGFAIRVRDGAGPGAVRTLDAGGFRDISFLGQYPIGTVDYSDADCPAVVRLEAFSPFIPLDEDNSGLPATIVHVGVTNKTERPIEVDLAGWMQNASCIASGTKGRGLRVNRFLRDGHATVLVCQAMAAAPESAPAGAAAPASSPASAQASTTPPASAQASSQESAPAPGASSAPAAPRPDLPFDDFETDVYEGWTRTGTAFGDKPRRLSDMARYQGDLNAHGQGLVNTHETRHGEDVRKADEHIGTLTSREFTIQRDFIRFRIGGGEHAGQTCMNLLVEGAPLRTATGKNDNRMRVESWNVRELAGRAARLQIVDAWSGGWGQIGVDEIVFTDVEPREAFALEEQPDFGTLALAVLDAPGPVRAAATLGDQPLPEGVFEAATGEAEARQDFPDRPVGVLTTTLKLGAGEQAGVTFVVAWHFDRVWREGVAFLTDGAKLRRHYGTRFKDAGEVVRYVAAQFGRLNSATRLWRDTWYDSTLPYWLLDRTLATASTLATSTCLRFDNGRFYGWEGTYCCAGTCTHVWQYAQAVARLFPGLERWVREHVDFGIAFHEDSGAMDYRAEAHKIVAHDGQAGTILRAYREHTTSPDAGFLQRCWPRIRKALEHLIQQDKDADGLLEGEQYNTLDTAWFGPMGWLSSLFLAAVRAGQAMAEEMGDVDFAQRCSAILDAGGRSLVEKLYNGEYFIHRPDPAHPEANNTNTGCHADQLLGQAHAHQVGLGRIVPREQTLSALRAIYKYNFTPDIGPYRSYAERAIRGGRWYAMPGEGGMIVCTWPNDGLSGARSAIGKGRDAWATAYFNECWTGFEHQVAAHMIWEGLMHEGLAITRMLHDRHHAARRNPFNEVECSSHYARAMAGYGTFIAICGFEYHGPRGYLAFSPRLAPERFKAAFTAAEGWGTLEQTRAQGVQRQAITVRYGRLRLRCLAFDLADGVTAAGVAVSAAGAAAPATMRQDGRRVRIELEREVVIPAGGALEVTIRAGEPPRDEGAGSAPSGSD